MAFRITPLPRATFLPLFALSNEELHARNARRVVAEVGGGYPCRVSLRDAQAGERLILAHYEHQSAATPFRASHAVYVREDAIEAELAPGEVPTLFRTRLLSVRAFDAEGMMHDADVVAGTALEPVIEAMLDDPKVAYLHLHYAKPGCYAARADRA